MSPSDSFIFPIISLQMSSSNLQMPFPFTLQLPQAMQPRTGLFPIQAISVTMPCASRAFAASLSAVKVLPSL